MYKILCGYCKLCFLFQQIRFFFSISLHALLTCNYDALMEHSIIKSTCKSFLLGFGSTFSAAEESVMMVPASPENISKQYKVSSQARKIYIFQYYLK